MAELESNKMREQKRVLGRINKAIFDISASIGIQPRQVFLGIKKQPKSNKERPYRKMVKIFVDKNFKHFLKLND